MPSLPQNLAASKNQTHAAMSKTSKVRSKSMSRAQSTSAESPTHVLCSSTRAGYTSRRTRDRRSRHRLTVAILFTIATLLALVVIGLVTYQVAQRRKANQLRNSVKGITTPTDNTDDTVRGQDKTPNNDPLPYEPGHASPNEKPMGRGVGPNNTRDDSVDKTPVESSYMGVPGKLWSFLNRYKMNVGLALGAMVATAGAYKYMVQPASSAPVPTLSPAPNNENSTNGPWDTEANNGTLTPHDHSICPHESSLWANETTCIPDPESPYAVDTEWHNAAYSGHEVPYVPTIIPYKPGPPYKLPKAPRRRRSEDGVEQTNDTIWRAQIVVGEVWPIGATPVEWDKPELAPDVPWVGGDEKQRTRAERFCNMWKRRNSILTTEKQLNEYYVYYPTTQFEPYWRYGGTNRVKYAGTSTVVNHLDEWVWGTYEYSGAPIEPTNFDEALKYFANERNWPSKITYYNGDVDMNLPQCRSQEPCSMPAEPVDDWAPNGECHDWGNKPILTFEIFYLPDLPKNTTRTPMKNGLPWLDY